MNGALDCGGNPDNVALGLGFKVKSLVKVRGQGGSAPCFDLSPLQ